MTATAPDRWNTSDYEEIFEAEEVDVPMLVPDLGIGPGRPIGWWGAPDAGKNVQVQSIALSIASGRPVFQLFPCSRGRVLWITYDMGLHATRLRFKQLANGMGLSRDDLHDQLELDAFPSVDLTSKGAQEAFTQRLRGFDFCVVDNLRNVVPGVNENDSGFGSYLGILNAAGAASGCTTSYLHHIKKGQGEIDGDSGRGTSATRAGSGTVWGIQGEGSAARRMNQVRAHDTAITLHAPFWVGLTIARDGVFDTGVREKAIVLKATDQEPISVARANAALAKIVAILRKNPDIGTVRLRKLAHPLNHDALDAGLELGLRIGQIGDHGTGGPSSPRKYYVKDPEGCRSAERCPDDG